jgi:Tfp pilus assembly protein PilX
MALAIEGQCMSRDERGSVLVSTMMFVLIITLIGAGIFYAAVVDNRMMRNDLNQDQTFYTAEAGLNIGLRELADSTSVNNFNHVFTNGGSVALFTNQPFPLDANNNARASYTVTAAAVPNTTPKQMTVTATGCTPAITTGSCPSANTQTTVQAVLIFQDTLAGPFFALGTFSIGAGSLVDSFDSSVGSYAATKCPQAGPQLGCGADVYADGGIADTPPPPITNVTVSVGNGTPIYGNIKDARGQVQLITNAAVWGNVTYDSHQGSFSGSNSQIHGTGGPGGVGPIDQPTSPPVPGAVQPCGPPYSPAANVNSKMHIVDKGKITYNASTGVFSFSGSSGGHMSIDPGTFCFSTLSVSGQGVVDILSSNTTSVILNVTGSASTGFAVDLTSGGVANATLKAENFQIISSWNGTTNGIQISGGPSAYMYVYAPYTQITVSGGANLYGALLGKTLTAAGGAQLHFDKALGNSGKLTGGIPNYTWSSGTWKTCKNPTCT